jgi:hypothetical protein
MIKPKIFIVLIILSFSANAFAWGNGQSGNATTKTELLKALDIAVTTAKQKVAYIMEMDFTRKFDTETKTHTYNVIYDPFATYGIDLRVQILKEDLHKYDEGDIKKKLDEIMALRMRLLSEDLYDENSLRLENPEGDDTIFSFKFDSEVLPNELQYFENLRGYVYIQDAILNKIILTNEVPFEHNKVAIEVFRKTLHFAQSQVEGTPLLDHIDLDIKGRKDNLPYSVKIEGRIIKYWSETKQKIAWTGGLNKRTDLPLDDRYETIYVDLDRPFPLLGKAARKAGYDLPKPFGVSLVTMLQNTTMHMTSFNVNDQDIGKLLGGDDAKVENSALALLVRADVWVLPFLNVGLLAGRTSTSSDIALQVLPDGLLGGLIEPGEVVTVEDAKSESTLYGFGTTITSYTEAADTELTMTIATPMVGYNFLDYGARILAGAQYQGTKEKIVAQLTRENGENLKAVVGIRSEKWAALIGIDKSLSRNWNCSLMYSNGEDRNNINFVLGYRF